MPLPGRRRLGGQGRPDLTARSKNTLKGTRRLGPRPLVRPGTEEGAVKLAEVVAGWQRLISETTRGVWRTIREIRKRPARNHLSLKRLRRRCSFHAVVI